MNNRHPLQLKKSKSWEPFGSYQLNSTANPAHLPQNRPNFEVNGLDWQCCLAGSSQRAPRIFIFSIVLGAKCLSYLKSIETHARAFFKVIIFSIGSVNLLFFYRQNWRWKVPRGGCKIPCQHFPINQAIAIHNHVPRWQGNRPSARNFVRTSSKIHLPRGGNYQHFWSQQVNFLEIQIDLRRFWGYLFLFSKLILSGLVQKFTFR